MPYVANLHQHDRVLCLDIEMTPDRELIPDPARFGTR